MGDRLAAWAEAVASRVFGPVFALDATRVGRRMSTFIARWIYLLVLVSVVVMFFNSWWRDLRSVGGVVHPRVLTRFAEEFFWVYVATQFFAVTLLTPAFTAGAISDEKERKTLDFLLITDLSGREIVFGKLAVRFGVLLTLVLAGLPVVALMQFFGGIEPRLLFLTVGMTLITVFSLCGISICASVLINRTRDAVMFAYGLPAVYVFFSTVLMNYLWRSEWRELAEFVAIGNPFFVGAQLDRAFATSGTPILAIRYLVFHAAVGVLGFALAAMRLRAAAEGRGIPGAKPRGKFRQFIDWLRARRSEARPHPPVSDAPVQWREVYVETGSGGGLVSRVLAAGLIAAIVLPFLSILYESLARPRGFGYYRDPWGYFQEQTQAWVCAVTCGLGIIMMLRVTVRGAAAFAGERDRDTWTSLVATPLSTRDIVHGKWMGCIWGQRSLMYLLAGVWGIGFLTESVNLISLLVAAGALVVYLRAFAAVGMRCSVTSRNTRVAIGRAVPIAIFIGGGYWFFIGCLCMGVGFRGSDNAIESIASFILGLTPPVVLGALPALDSDFFQSFPNRDLTAFTAMVLGGITGMIGWSTIAHLTHIDTRQVFDAETNRSTGDPRGGPSQPRGNAREEPGKSLQ